MYTIVLGISLGALLAWLFIGVKDPAAALFWSKSNRTRTRVVIYFVVAFAIFVAVASRVPANWRLH